jgi:ABC-2 type transport system ATP-binding protein
MIPHPAIDVVDLVRDFGHFRAVDGVAFQVPPGEVFGFLGPNGAGKTTCIRMMLGLLAPSGGSIHILGRDITRNTKVLQGRLGYMSQAFTLYPDLTAVENIAFYGRVYGLSRSALRRRTEEVIAMAGLTGQAHSLTASLSGGWRQRLALGCAILHRPELLFLDEPTAGVDPVSRRQFWDLIYRLAKDGTTVFVTTHYMDEAEHCERVGFIDQGKLIALGSPDALKAEWMEGEVLELECTGPAAAVRLLGRQSRKGLPGILEVSLYGAQIHVVVADTRRDMQSIRELLAAEGISVQAIQQIPPSLEDVFIARVGRSIDRDGAATDRRGEELGR